jgi:DNA repair protein RadC
MNAGEEERIPRVFQETPATSRVKNTAPAELPRERFLRRGAGALSDAELIAIILGSGVEGHDVLKVATRLVHEAGNLSGLIDFSPRDFQLRPGIGPVKALQLATIFEIAKRVLEQRNEPRRQFETPEQVFEFFASYTQGLKIEKCWVLCLDSQHRLIRCEEVSVGIRRQTLIEPVAVFTSAVRNGAASIIVVHNHPGGDPEPSKADYAATRSLTAAGNVLDIPLQDHVILGTTTGDRLGKGWFSFNAAGII